MRSNVLAGLLKDFGAQVTFACRDCDGHMIPFLKEQGYGVNIISSANNIKFSPNDYSTWLGGGVEGDISQSFAGNHYDLVIIDHYGAGLAWQKAARNHGEYIMVIDDEANSEFDCDILLNQNYYPETACLYDGKLSSKCIQLIGSQYALLRGEFALHRKDVGFRTKLNNLLVMMGGADADQITLKIVNALDLDIDVSVVVGNAYQDPDILQKLCKDKGFSFIKGALNIAEIMGVADFCIGAGGSTSWERCSMKLPSAIFAVAKNQVCIAENLSKARAAIYLGNPQYFDFDGINNMLLKLDDDKLSAMSKAAGGLSDGSGAKRVLLEISELLFLKKK